MTRARRPRPASRAARPAKAQPAQGRDGRRPRPTTPAVGHLRHRRVGARGARARRHHPRGRQLHLQRDRRLAHLRAAIDVEKCNGCMLCYFYCPDAAIIIEGEQGGRRRPGPLQGLRHLRPRVPRRRPSPCARGEGVSRGDRSTRTSSRSPATRPWPKAMRQIDPDVVAAYPITPQTEIVQIFAQFVADGKVDTEFITVESEHSAMSAAIGSAAGGARTMTATSSQGLALMWELLYIAASLPPADRHGQRQPRALGPDQHPLRPLRLHGRARHRLDPALRRGPPGGLRQPPHGRAHRRAPRGAPAGHDDDRRLHRERRHRPAARCSPTRRCRSSSAPTRPSTRCSTPRTRSRWARSTACTAGSSSTRSSQNRAMERALRGHRRGGRGVRRAHRPPLRPARPYRMDDAEIAIVVVGSTAGDDAHRRRQAARRRASRPACSGCACSGPSPCRSTPRLLQRRARSSASSTAPTRSAPRAGRCSSRSARRSTTAHAAPGRAVHLRPRRARHLPRQHRRGVRALLQARPRRRGRSRRAHAI